MNISSLTDKIRILSINFIIVMIVIYRCFESVMLVLKTDEIIRTKKMNTEKKNYDNSE
jgi:hypothetical protein